MMNKALHVLENERGIVRVFRLELGKSEMKAFTAQEVLDDGHVRSPVKQALGAPVLDHDQVEIFPVSDLIGMGLSAYLVNGQGVLEEDIKADREKLDALTGYVMVVRTAAFEGKEARLKGNYPLEFIGSYRDETSKTEIVHPRPAPAVKAAAWAQETTEAVAQAEARRGGWGPFFLLLLWAAGSYAVWQFGSPF